MKRNNWQVLLWVKALIGAVTLTAIAIGKNMAGAVSLFLRILVFRTVASAFFPLVWQLWFSIGVMLFGTFAYWETVQHRLPNHRIIYRYMPTGLLQTVMMLFIGQQASKLLAIWQPDPGQRVLDEMVYLALPGVALTLLAMVGREGRRRDLTWGHRFAAVPLFGLLLHFNLGWF